MAISAISSSLSTLVHSMFTVSSYCPYRHSRSRTRAQLHFPSSFVAHLLVLTSTAHSTSTFASADTSVRVIQVDPVSMVVAVSPSSSPVRMRCSCGQLGTQGLLWACERLGMNLEHDERILLIGRRLSALDSRVGDSPIIGACARLSHRI